MQSKPQYAVGLSGDRGSTRSWHLTSRDRAAHASWVGTLIEVWHADDELDEQVLFKPEVRDGRRRSSRTSLVSPR